MAAGVLDIIPDLPDPILPDKINILFTDTPFYWGKDRLLIEQYTGSLRLKGFRELCDNEDQ